jgi:hypothetical protein
MTSLRTASLTVTIVRARSILPSRTERIVEA